MIDFSKFFHVLSKDHTQGRNIKTSKDFREQPKEWRTVYYKTYPRLQKIMLPRVEHKADFYELVTARRSERRFTKDPADLGAISTVLAYSCGLTHEREGGRSRAQASGGGRFPIEVYPLIFRGSENFPSGVYHYNVREHALDVLSQRAFSDRDIEELFTHHDYEWVRDASVVFIMTALFHRTQMKYGERGYRYVLLEAGHIGQNMYLNAAALGLKCSALGGTLDERIEEMLDVDGVTESVVYAVAMG